MLPDSTLSRSEIREKGKIPNPFYKQYQDMIEKHAQEVRDKQDTPFDEIYHKERKLVSDIIKAELALKALKDKLPNPAGYMKVDMTKEEMYADIFAES